MTRGGKPKAEACFVETMQATGFTKRHAERMNDFWTRHGVTGVQIGSKTLKIKPRKSRDAKPL